MRKPVKPTDEQRDLIFSICSELRAIERTNDLNSPTHNSDINNFLRQFDIDEKIEQNITSALRLILENIRIMGN